MPLSPSPRRCGRGRPVAVADCSGVVFWGFFGFLYWFPLFFSNADLANLTQTDTSAVFPAIPALGANARGSYETMYIKDSDDIFLVMPGYGVAGYDGGYSGNLRLNFLNKSNNPQTVKATSGNSLDAVKIFYMDQEVTKL